MSNNFIIVIGFSVFCCWVIGSVYLGLGNTYSYSYKGILKKGEVFTENSCSSSTTCDSKGNNCHTTTTCSNTYYVDEIFYKGDNTTSTCTVRRLTPYYFKCDADNFFQG